MEVYSLKFAPDIKVLRIKDKPHKYYALMHGNDFIENNIPPELLVFEKECMLQKYTEESDGSRVVFEQSLPPGCTTLPEWRDVSYKLSLKESKRIFCDGTFVEKSPGEKLRLLVPVETIFYDITLFSGQRFKINQNTSSRFMENLVEFKFPSKLEKKFPQDIVLLIKKFVGNRFYQILIDEKVEVRVVMSCFIDYCGIKLLNTTTGEIESPNKFF